MTSTRPTVAGVLFRGYAAVLEDRGLLALVREQVSEETRALIDDPPAPLEWVPTTAMEEMMDALGRLHGRELVKDVGLETARTKAGPLVIPFMRTLLALWGATPQSIFKHIGRLTGVTSRGLELAYVPGTPTSGTVELVYQYPISDHVYATWEGVFHLAFEVCGVKGTIDRAEVLDEGRWGRIKVRWEPGK